MKTNGTRILRIAIIFQLLLLVFSFTSKAAPDYDFSKGVLFFGTDKTVGAKYRFTKVKTGVDAIITITALTNGVTLNAFDGTSSGFKEAFQPEIRVPANTSGYAEFNISFVLTGTLIPAIMLEVPLTPIDVDGKTTGGGKVYEYDMINWGLGLGSYVDFNLLGGEIKVSSNPGWVTGRNMAGTDYGGVDTMAKQAMFTVVVPSIPSIVVRVGADNQTNSPQDRLRSIYFKKFDYPHSFLALPALSSFRGIENNNKVELQWELNTDNKLSSVIVERATNPAQFQQVAQFWLSADEAVKQAGFKFNDNPNSGRVYYRLKMISPNGSVQYSSVLVFHTAASAGQETLKVYPTSIQSSVTLNIKADKAGSATFQLVDYSGRVVMQQPISLLAGTNNISVNNLSNLNTGNYVAVVKTDANVYSQKVLKQ
jgi:hypothetical protein